METLKQFLLKKYPTNEYFDCPVQKHHWEVMQEYAEHYARTQIKKDRDRVKKAVTDYDMYIDEDGLQGIYDDTPINLD